MGANAQTSVPAFTAGQVLTAAQVNNINTGIPVFASSTERDAAFGGTGEKTLAEGQMAYLEDTNATQYYDGSSWAAVAGGKILQIVTATYSTEETTTSTSYVATSLTATITPSSATSQVIAHLVFPWRCQRSSNIYSGNADFALYRGASQIHESTVKQYKDNAGNANRWLHVVEPMLYVDSPATTSATTYTLYHKTGGGMTLETFVLDEQGIITLWEVSA